jgi:hypothetical protein
LEVFPMDSGLLSLADRTLLQTLFTRGFLQSEEALTYYRNFLEVTHGEEVQPATPNLAQFEALEPDVLVSRLNGRLNGADFSVRLVSDDKSKAYLTLCNTREDASCREACLYSAHARAVFEGILKKGFLNPLSPSHQEGSITFSECVRIAEQLPEHVRISGFEAELLQILVEDGWLERLPGAPASRSNNKTEDSFRPGVRTYAELREMEQWRLRRLQG